ncbi:type II secretion system F family protein [Cloacibacillus sp. An23]|uniref:type II secretion system F family protein n=1 Tax=Cloacibacillus sp. An23 TaxID=1965591 RepID=UPI000B36E261|nr:type II secretion system F family protein [Cloacibacillus sp. An23]
MPLYRAEVYTQEGARKILRREAASENDLLRELESERCAVVSVKEEKARAWSFAGGSRRKKLSLEEQRLFCATLSSFMRSGLSLTEVLKLLQKQTRGKNLKPVYTELRESVEGGRSLAASMTALGVFRPGLVGMVESGEKSASLGEILEKAGELLQNEISLRRKIQTALTYPMLMLLVGLGVVVFLLSFVVPRLTALVIESGAELPFITKALIFVSHAVRVGVVPFAAAVALLALWMRRRNKKIALPFFREARENLTFALIFSQTGTLLRAGIPLVQALKLTEPLDPVKGRLSTVAGYIKEGYRFSQALEKEGSFPEEITTVIRVGEAGASLPETAERLGAGCWEYAQTSMQKWATLAEPLIILVMGLLVGFVVVAVLLPIFDLSSLAGR